MGFAQKRQYDRYQAALLVTYERDGARVKAFSRDVSLGGMFVETEEQLPYGTKCSIEVSLPALPEPVVIEATVRWNGPDGMGLQWGMLRARETWAINQLTSKK